MTGLNLNGEEMRKMTDRIASENKLKVEVNTADGATIEAGKSWADRLYLGGFFKYKSKDEKAAGFKGEFKW